MKFKEFDYSNPIHQQIGVKLTILHWSTGDLKDVYEDEIMFNEIWAEFNLSEMYREGISITMNEVMEKWLDQNSSRFDGSYLQLNPDNSAQFRDTENTIPEHQEKQEPSLTFEQSLVSPHRKDIITPEQAESLVKYFNESEDTDTHSMEEFVGNSIEDAALNISDEGFVNENIYYIICHLLDYEPQEF